MDAIELSLFASRLAACCDEMGAVLRNAALSPNIRDRLDFSCAVFSAAGTLSAQAAHIPVHLGSMAYAMADLVARLPWADGDMAILNDPFLGGTHLPDVTLIAPVFLAGECIAFVVNRAHHADIGAAAPGSMPISRDLAEEGLIIPPQHLLRGDRIDAAALAAMTGATRNPDHTHGDLLAQIAANRAGRARVTELAAGLVSGRAGQSPATSGAAPGAPVDPAPVSSTAPDDLAAAVATWQQALAALDNYGERLARAALRALPDGDYLFEDQMDDDGQGQWDIPIRLRLTVQDGRIHCDFSGTAPQVVGNINCPLAVTAAAVFYCIRCLLPAQTPACAGSFRPLGLSAPPGSLVNAQRPAAVAAGNVETSQRIVDVVLGALAQVPGLAARIPAASHGSMNNLALGGWHAGRPWDYYETIGGGMGASARGPGLSGVQCHMTNTLNTPIEVIETGLPLRVTRYALRRGSGGQGCHGGGDGLVREYLCLAPAQATLIGERRRHAPWGLAGGGPGALGWQQVNGRPIAGKAALQLAAGDRLTIATPGGGGWGDPDSRAGPATDSALAPGPDSEFDAAADAPSAPPADLRSS
ncbi:MAG: hydantoinase B/oxoprolinase family protein [Chromatiaceae bacterium]|nr:MAG: hydantoinase B/oxoprolinase family protein [Chromatiaceae bacterium]